MIPCKPGKAFPAIAWVAFDLLVLSLATACSESTITTEIVEPEGLNGISADAGQVDARPIASSTYQAMLHQGMDVDWAGTASGRQAAQRSHAAGVNVPRLFQLRGLSHVRIRVKEDVLTDQSLLSEIGNLLDDCLEADLIPIIAYQAEAFRDDPQNDVRLNAVVDWWGEVARRFRSYPYRLAYNVVIEATGELTKHNDRLNLLYRKVAQRIHEIDEKRIIIIAPNGVSNPYELDNLVVPEPSDYIMAEWHFYAAGPQKDNPKKQWTTGTEAEKELILDKIEFAANWSQRHGIPTWVGAWMANDYNAINRDNVRYDGAPGGGAYTVAEQKVFSRFMVKSLCARDIPFAVNSDTLYFNRDTNQWYDSVAEVLDTIVCGCRSRCLPIR